MSAPDKRIVLIHTTGRYAGLWRIVGTESQLQEKFTTTELPAHVGEVDFLDHEGSCDLIRVRPRYVVYREAVVPPTAPVL